MRESVFVQELVGTDVVRPEGPMSHSHGSVGDGQAGQGGIQTTGQQDRYGRAEPLTEMERRT